MPIARRTSPDPETSERQLSLDDSPERPLQIRDAAEPGPPSPRRRLASAESRARSIATPSAHVDRVEAPSSALQRRSAGVARFALSPDEAARSLGVSRSFFFAKILPRLKVVRVGRRQLVSVRELDRWLEAAGDRIVAR